MLISKSLKISEKYLLVLLKLQAKLLPLGAWIIAFVLLLINPALSLINHSLIQKSSLLESKLQQLIKHSGPDSEKMSANLWRASAQLNQKRFLIGLKVLQKINSHRVHLHHYLFHNDEITLEGFSPFLNIINQLTKSLSLSPDIHQIRLSSLQKDDHLIHYKFTIKLYPI